MGLYTGFDLHSSNTYVGVIDGDGRRLWKKKLRNDPSLISSTLKPFKEDIEGIIVESIFNWYWLMDLLIGAGYRVRLANPSRIQQYSGLKHGDHEHDAFWLAEMLRLKILPEGYIYPKEQRPLRDLFRITDQNPHSSERAEFAEYMSLSAHDIEHVGTRKS